MSSSDPNRSPLPTGAPVEALIISRITWSMLALLLLALRALRALWVSSWTFTDFTFRHTAPRYLNLEGLTRLREPVICPGAYFGL